MGVILTNEMIQGAKLSQQKYGVPASVTLAQIMQESGGSNKGGLSGLAYSYNNLFGMTAGSNWSGDTVTMSNKAGTDTKTYRIYDSIQDSIDDHGRLLSTDRYTKYTKDAKNVNDYVQGIANAGYAEDKNYAASLIKIIKDNNLTQYDDYSNTSNNLSHSSGGGVNIDNNKDVNLKWWGDIIVVVLVLLLIILAVIFFINAFNIKPLKNIKNKIKGG